MTSGFRLREACGPIFLALIGLLLPAHGQLLRDLRAEESHEHYVKQREQRRRTQAIEDAESTAQFGARVDELRHEDAARFGAMRAGLKNTADELHSTTENSKRQMADALGRAMRGSKHRSNRGEALAESAVNELRQRVTSKPEQAKQPIENAPALNASANPIKRGVQVYERPIGPKPLAPPAWANEAVEPCLGPGELAAMAKGTVSAISTLGTAVRSRFASPPSSRAIPGTPANSTYSAIRISAERLKHVETRHFSNGRNAAQTSVFHTSENLSDLVKFAERVSPVKQNRGQYYERIVDAGREIGIDSNNGTGTQFYTVITDNLGNLVTAFPGNPTSFRSLAPLP